MKKTILDGKPKGSVYARQTSKGVYKLYYKSPYFNNNKPVATGLIDTPSNRRQVVFRLSEYHYQHVFGYKIKEIAKKTIHQCFDEYINDKESTGKLHYNTIRNYKTAFNHVFPVDFLIAESVNNGYKEIFRLEKEVEKYVNSSKHCNVSINIYLRAIRTFLNWALKKGYLPEIKLNDYFPPVTEKKPYAYSNEEIEMMLEYFREKGNQDFINFLIFVVETGTRLTETLRLKWTDVDLDAKTISFPKKNKRNIIDTIPISNSIYQLLKDLKAQSHFRKSNSHLVFRWGENNKRYLSKLLTKCLKDLGIKKDGVVFHSTRKNFLTELMKRGVNTFYLKQLARHSDIKTTEKYYLDFNKNQELKEILDNNAPKMNLKNEMISDSQIRSDKLTKNEKDNRIKKKPAK